MKKIKLTEKQLGMVSEFVENESNETVEQISESSSDNQYKRDDIQVSLYYSGVKYKGFEINHIECADTTLLFSIDQEHRSWGIKNIYIYGIRGEEKLELEIDYFPNDNDDLEQSVETITVDLNWDNLEVNNSEGSGVVTVGDDIEITLENDSEGNIIVKSMEIEALTM
jgi:hypothetical protein